MIENHQSRDRLFLAAVLSCCLALLLALLTGCDAERRKSDAELGLDARQATGRHLYDQYCERCHNPSSTRGRQGPGLKGVFKKPYLAVSGIPSNDARVGEIIMIGRGKMEGYGNVLTQQQLADMLAYMHTL